MWIETGRVRAPEIGRFWLNSPPLSLRGLRGKVVLIDFWDYTCVNCLRTLPYVQTWHERYHEQGLVVIGVHTPEFTFARYESNVERGVREFGLTYPVVVDSDFEIWRAFANRYWPAKYLIDKDGYIRYAHFGEGEYAETEEALQQLLKELDPDLQFTKPMEPLRAEDRPGAVCYQPTPELYLGHKRGHIGNEGGFAEDQTSDYDFSGTPKQQPGGAFYARGRWSSTAEWFGTSEEHEHRIALSYSAAGVNLVMAQNLGPSEEIEVEIRQDGAALQGNQATPDTLFRTSENGDSVSYVLVDRPRMYRLVDNHDFGDHLLELICRRPGLQAYAFTFTSCVDPAKTRAA